MKARDLIRLPFGSYKATDGIWNYDISKTKCEDGSPIYSIKESIASWHTVLSLFEIEDYVFEEEYRYRNGDYKCIRLRGLAGVGGLKIFSNDTYDAIYRIKLLPRGSFKEYVSKEIASSLTHQNL